MPRIIPDLLKSVRVASRRLTLEAAARGLALFVLIAALPGCDGKASSAADRQTDRTHLGVIAMLVNNYQGQNLGLMPKDEATFRKFVETQADWAAQMADTSSVDEIYVSEQDDQPLVLCFGKELLKFNGAAVIGYEQTAQDGKRLIGFAGGDAKFVDEAAFRAVIEK